MAHVSMIVAKSKNNAIGKDNKLLWHIPEDLRYFKKKTENKIVIMGRKTYESIGKPLPNRINVVVSTNENFVPVGSKKLNKEELRSVFNENNKDNLFIVNDMKQIYEIISQTSEEVFIIGGSSLYEQFMDIVETLYITEVDLEIEGDTFFPKLDRNLILTSSADNEEHSDYKYTFDIYERLLN